MRLPCGCPIEDGIPMHGYDGPCADAPLPLEPTIEDYCAMGGHAYAGDDGDGSEGTMGRCYCGAQTYPAGGPS